MPPRKRPTPSGTQRPHAGTGSRSQKTSDVSSDCLRAGFQAREDNGLVARFVDRSSRQPVEYLAAVVGKALSPCSSAQTIVEMPVMAEMPIR
jgi:hypothetical protein